MHEPRQKPSRSSLSPLLSASTPTPSTVEWNRGFGRRRKHEPAETGNGATSPRWRGWAPTRNHRGKPKMELREEQDVILPGSARFARSRTQAWWLTASCEQGPWLFPSSRGQEGGRGLSHRDKAGSPRRAPSVMCTPKIHLVIASSPDRVMIDSFITDIAAWEALRHGGSLGIEVKHGRSTRRTSCSQGCATAIVASQTVRQIKSNGDSKSARREMPCQHIR